MTRAASIGRDAYWRLSVSYRRTLLDHLLQQQQQRIHGAVLDVGGEKHSTVLYRLQPSDKTSAWLFLNVNPMTDPDILADGAHPPLHSASVDTVLCLETLEHVTKPERVVLEIARILRPGGVAILSMPFLYHLHSQPYDYWRFTRYAAERMVQKAGLQVTQTYVVGRFFTVLGDMIKYAIASIRLAPLRWLLWILVLLPAGMMVFLEQRGLGRNSAALSAFATGHVICATKLPSLDTTAPQAR
jgi:SAM-dependent methyltransferase